MVTRSLSGLLLRRPGQPGYGNHHNDSFLFIRFMDHAGPGLLTVPLPAQLEGFCCAESGRRGCVGVEVGWYCIDLPASLTQPPRSKNRFCYWQTPGMLGLLNRPHNIAFSYCFLFGGFGFRLNISCNKNLQESIFRKSLFVAWRTLPFYFCRPKRAPMQVLNSHFLSILKGWMEYREVRKHAFLLKPGQVCRELFFIRSGLVRSYYREKDTEISACFMKENDWLLSIESFYEQTPTREYFQALEDTEVYAITRPQLQHTLQAHPALQHFERLLTQHYYQQWNQQLLATRLQTARHR